MEILPFQEENFEKIIRKLENEEIVIMPSDTSYGLSGDPFSEAVIRKIQDIKRRPENKPFLLLVASPAEAKKWGAFSPALERFAMERWQSEVPTTVLVPKNSELQNFFPEFSTIGIRVPTLDPLRKFLDLWGKPLISTSANISGEDPIFFESEIIRNFQKEEICFVNFGDLPKKRQSEIWKEENTILVRVR